MRKELENLADEILKCKTFEEAFAVWVRQNNLMMDELYKSNEEKARMAINHLEKCIPFDDPDTIY